MKNMQVIREQATFVIPVRQYNSRVLIFAKTKPQVVPSSEMQPVRCAAGAGFRITASRPEVEVKS
jgi:hypothetical protein